MIEMNLSVVVPIIKSLSRARCAGPDFFNKHPSCSFITCYFKKKDLEVCAECFEFTGEDTIFQKMTSLLHYKADSNSITIEDLEQLFKSILTDKQVANL